VGAVVLSVNVIGSLYDDEKSRKDGDERESEGERIITDTVKVARLKSCALGGEKRAIPRGSVPSGTK
jgi:hypothetical protein